MQWTKSWNHHHLVIVMFGNKLFFWFSIFLPKVLEREVPIENLYFCVSLGFQLMINCWFGLVFDSPYVTIPFIFGDPRNPNHRAPNHQLTISWGLWLPTLLGGRRVLAVGFGNTNTYQHLGCGPGVPGSKNLGTKWSPLGLAPSQDASRHSWRFIVYRDSLLKMK